MPKGGGNCFSTWSSGDASSMPPAARSATLSRVLHLQARGPAISGRRDDPSSIHGLHRSRSSRRVIRVRFRCLRLGNVSSPDADALRNSLASRVASLACLRRNVARSVRRVRAAQGSSGGRVLRLEGLLRPYQLCAHDRETAGMVLLDISDELLPDLAAQVPGFGRVLGRGEHP
jgi:hypothetical protein